MSLLGSDDFKGNTGLFSQRLALKWVVENNAVLMGDPSFMTLFGLSPDAESVVYHVLSLGIHRLFRYIILQSGTQSVSIDGTLGQ